MWGLGGLAFRYWGRSRPPALDRPAGTGGAEVFGQRNQRSIRFIASTISSWLPAYENRM